MPDADPVLTIEHHGPASLAAFGSANPKASGSFQASTTKAFHGEALAILRKKGGGGAVRVSVSSPSLTSAAVTVRLAR